MDLSRTSPFCLIGTTLFLFFGSPLFAQIVNIEDQRLSQDTTGLFWQLDFGGRLTENTSSVISVNGAMRVDYRRPGAAYLFLANYNFIKANEDRFINDGFGHLRYSHSLNHRWQWESFGQIQYNRKLLIDLRALAGSGFRFQITEDKRWDLATGLMYMYEYNELDEGETTRHDIRLSGYLSARIQFNDRTTFASTSYYQPLLKAFAESRLSSVNTLTVGIGAHISLSSSFSVTYDGLLSKVAEVPWVNYDWRNTVRIRF